MDSTLLMIIGLAAGVLAGLFGIGGGIIIVPALVYVARLPLQTAIGTSLGALLLPVGALGAWSYYRGGHLDWRAALWVALGLFFGAFFGAKLAQAMTDASLRRMFSVVLVVVAVKMWMS
ncbi:MAG: sulfite exporter TauE/SafE family protein [Gemmatimonadetes bacterium]|nr:sulfite exporter TauE/SafE family protein [Gemmatimonadota bacterium]